MNKKLAHDFSEAALEIVREFQGRYANLEIASQLANRLSTAHEDVRTEAIACFIIGQCPGSPIWNEVNEALELTYE